MIGLLAVSYTFSPLPTHAASSPPPDAGDARLAPKIDASSRPYVEMVGSSQMHESLTPVITKAFTDAFKVDAPNVRLTGTAAGIKEFCAGVGVEYPDIVAASRNMRKAEFEDCQKNGVLDIIEVKVGALPVMVMTKKGNPTFEVTPRMVYLAAAETLPAEDGDFDNNEHTKWSDVSKTGPEQLIKIIVPDPASGSRGFFDDNFMEGGCRHYPGIDEIFASIERVKKCTTLRTDGVVVEIPEPYDQGMITALTSAGEDTIAIAIAGELTYLANQDQLTILPVHGFMPSRENVLSDDYQLVAFPRYYVKRGHMRNKKGKGVVRGLRELIRIMSSEKMVGPDGAFDNLGLIPLDDDEREEGRRDALNLKSYTGKGH